MDRLKIRLNVSFTKIHTRSNRFITGLNNCNQFIKMSQPYPKLVLNWFKPVKGRTVSIPSTRGLTLNEWTLVELKASPGGLPRVPQGQANEEEELL